MSLSATSATAASAAVSLASMIYWVRHGVQVTVPPVAEDGSRVALFAETSSESKTSLELDFTPILATCLFLAVLLDVLWAFCACASFCCFRRRLQTQTSESPETPESKVSSEAAPELLSLPSPARSPRSPSRTRELGRCSTGSAEPAPQEGLPETWTERLSGLSELSASVTPEEPLPETCSPEPEGLSAVKRARRLLEEPWISEESYTIFEDESDELKFYRQRCDGLMRSLDIFSEAFREQQLGGLSLEAEVERLGEENSTLHGEVAYWRRRHILVSCIGAGPQRIPQL